jgi:hypothetical protein
METWNPPLCFTNNDFFQCPGFVLYFNPRPTRVRSNLADFKLMLNVAFDHNRVLVYKVIPGERAINVDQFFLFLRNTLWPAMRENRIYRSIIRMDNARPHFISEISDFIRL